MFGLAPTATDTDSGGHRPIAGNAAIRSSRVVGAGLDRLVRDDEVVGDYVSACSVTGQAAARPRLEGFFGASEASVDLPAVVVASQQR